MIGFAHSVIEKAPQIVQRTSYLSSKIWPLHCSHSHPRKKNVVWSKSGLIESWFLKSQTNECSAVLEVDVDCENQLLCRILNRSKSLQENMI